MSERLSSKGKDLKELCDTIAQAVTTAIGGMVGTAESGQMVKMGADGTPTKSIDRIAENAVLGELRSSGLGFRVLSEEIGEVLIGEQPDYFLHLDPLDGTFNAIKGIPFYSVSIYLSRDDCHLGYVCDLARGTKYFAQSGRGAWSEPGGRLCVSRNEDLENFSISAYTMRPHTARIVGLGDRVRRIRSLGSTSLEMAMVASGKLDAFVDLRGMMRVVDVAAGKLILEEAGGLITDADGKELHLDGNMWQRTDLIGSNGLRHLDLLRLIGGGSH
ncbi:MAG TPA: bifunctional fructose-bisphosphatase/inositol-phosphate phosphatase [Methanothrix sp.]|nr:bifunctional fructose-bisphosphatase/inositol-phosphate phosphatase [Methanothrix sp.]